jgi:hypothetical protein
MGNGTIQKEFNYSQKNDGTPDEVFPLLCPVREKEWIDGWEYEMIYSKSGLVEEGCVFTTPHHGSTVTTWYVTRHDSKLHYVEFIRFTPGETVVRIQIQMEELPGNKTASNISYQYTGLNEHQNAFIENKMQDDFHQSMLYWEKAINYYLTTGQKLMKDLNSK